MLIKQFSLHNAILLQVRKESDRDWATSKGYMPPAPKYKKAKIKFRPANIVAFATNFIKSMRP